MSVSDSIIEWLEEFEHGSKALDKVNTDMQSDSASTYALIKEPIINVKRYLSGKEVHTEHYEISARLNTQTNTSRKSNSEWLESLEKWISENNASGNLPQVQDAEVESVNVTSAYYIGTTNENTSVYSITIAITYTI